MAALIPEQVAVTEVIHRLMRAGLLEVSRGKVSHMFGIPEYPELLLKFASNRISIYDWVLPSLVPYKGAVLTAMTVFWLQHVLSTVENHLVAYGSGIDRYLPEELRGNRELQTQAVVVRKLDMILVECIVRGFLTGSGWESYQETGKVSGHELPAGLHDGSILPEPLFTPTTKAEVGHDEHLQAADVVAQHPGIDELSLYVYRLIHEASMERGFAFADTKFEFGTLGNGLYILGDEVGTPDSSRFWEKDEWAAADAQQKSPSPYDKQFMRDWGRSAGVTASLKEDNPEHVALVHGITVPKDIIGQTTDIYREIAGRMLEAELEDFWGDEMGIRV